MNKEKIEPYIKNIEILDKVTDKLKEVKQEDEVWNTLNGELAVWTFAQELLNIIEGEKK